MTGITHILPEFGGDREGPAPDPRPVPNRTDGPVAAVRANRTIVLGDRSAGHVVLIPKGTVGRLDRVFAYREALKDLFSRMREDGYTSLQLGDLADIQSSIVFTLAVLVPLGGDGMSVGEVVSGFEVAGGVAWADLDFV